MDINADFERAIRHHKAGRLDEARKTYESILAAVPDHADVTRLLGVVHMALGNLETSLSLLQRCVQLAPDFADAYNDLGRAFATLRRWPEAIRAYEQALRAFPGLAEAHHNLGDAFTALGNFPAAIACFERSLMNAPDLIESRCRLGILRLKDGQIDEAIAAFDTVIARDPDHAGAHYHRGEAMFALRRFDEAVASFRRTLVLKPAFPEIYVNLGRAFEEQNKNAEALACYREALRLKSDSVPARFCAALVQLRMGDYRGGFKKYEIRWRRRLSRPRRVCGRPLWLGAKSLEGKSILLHAEQGLGDTLQFVRYAPLVAARGATVFLEVQPPLVSLLTGLPGVAGIFARGATLPPFDLHSPLLSLPLAFRTELPTIPSEVPYVRAPAERIRRWKDRLSRLQGVKVGIAWSGNTAPNTDRRRSISLREFEPVLSVSGCHFVCLQKEISAIDAATLHSRSILDPSREIKDFADTAGLAAQLDLVISVDTSVAHLAGALGLPTWILLPFTADWRWLTDRNDSPWYPSVRLFRQTRSSDWTTVIETVVASLGMKDQTRR